MNAPPGVDPVALYLKHQKFIRKWVAVYRDQYHMDEDDLLSQADLMFVQCLPKYDPSHSFLAWFKKRLLGGFLSMVRKAARRDELFHRDESVDPDEVPVETAALDDDPINHPDGRALAASTFVLTKDWLALPACNVRAELRRRMAAKQGWNRKRFDGAAAAIAAHLSRSK